LAKNGGLLSKIWVHSFSVNDRYMQTRPGTANKFGKEDWAWDSKDSPIEKRKERFLRLITLLEETRAKYPKFSYGISDPFNLEYLFSWSEAKGMQMLFRWDVEEAKYGRKEERHLLSAN
jgi:hypothetical protein